jgi:hypothetical protein
MGGRIVLELLKRNKVAEQRPVSVNNFIAVYQADPSTVRCNSIIEHSEGQDWHRSQVLASADEGIVDLTFRDSHQQGYVSHDSPAVHKPMLDFASGCLDSYLATFPSANKFPSFSVTESYQVLRYLDGGAYHTVHSDFYPYGMYNRRHLTGVGFLNDVAEGGELVFPQQNDAIRPQAGRFVIFPSGWTHSHKTLPPVGQSRYVLQMWWGFDQYGDAPT